MSHGQLRMVYQQFTCTVRGRKRPRESGISFRKANEGRTRKNGNTHAFAGEVSRVVFSGAAPAKFWG